MQKYTEPCINTSTFAKLCNTNKRTLIYYDEIGLFKPAYTDERGYRYYSETQCDIFFTITCLKDLGMPLKEIQKYVTAKNPKDLTALLLAQKKKIHQELQYLKRIEHVINNKIRLVSEGVGIQFDALRCSEPFLQECPEEYFITTPFIDTNEHEKIFAALMDHIGQVTHQHLNIGHPYGAMMKVSDLQQGIYDQYGCFMTRIADNMADKLTEGQFHLKKAGTYAVIYLRGDYYKAEHAFQKLLDYIEEQKLETMEYCYKEAIWDELTVEDMESYITRISIGVGRN